MDDVVLESSRKKIAGQTKEIVTNGKGKRKVMYLYLVGNQSIRSHNG